MVAYFYKENKKISLTPTRREAICSDINEMFKDFYSDLDASRRETEDILAGLFPDTNTDKIDKIPDLYEQYKTYISALQRACYPVYRALVDIEGLDLESNALASAYKSSLVYDWYNIDLLRTINKTSIDWTIKGESALFVCWREDFYQVTNTQVNQYIDELGNLVQETVKVKEDIPTFQAVDVKAINPHSLFFDKSQKDDWDNCRKIYRDFVPLETLLANKSYNLTPEERKELRDMIKNANKEDGDSRYDVDNNSELKIFGNTVEVLEFEGTYTLPDSAETLRRMEATVIAGKFLAKFQESDKPKSPFIWACYMERPDTGRGQSPLKIPQIINSVENMCLDLAMACWVNTANPVFLAPKGAFPKAINIVPGKPVEYDSLMLDQAPRAIDFSAGMKGVELTNFLKEKMQNATGITQYMQGSQDGSVRTASEASYIHSGANMRMSREAFLFSHNVLYPLVRLYALYKKVFDTNDIELRQEDGNYVVIDEKIRNGRYKFIIGGSQSAMEKEAETKKIFELFGLPVFQTLAQVIDPLSASQLMKWVMNRLNLQGTTQVEQMLDMNDKLRQFAQSQGIDNNNIPQFQEDARNYIQDNIPQIGNQMLQQMMAMRNQQQ